MASHVDGRTGREARSRCIAAAAVAALGLLVGACASSPDTRPHPKLEVFWADYEKLPDHKAIAVAGSLRGSRWVSGAAAGLPDAEAARQAALEECGRRRIKRRVQAQCVPYADGMEIVWRGR